MTVYPWQRSHWRRLDQRLRASTLPHALLLTGQEGLGKDAFARALAKRALCQQPGPEGACGECRACLLFEAGTHPDVQWVLPEETGKAIKVDQIRSLTAFAGLSRHQGVYKIAIITPAHAMNLNAANSLLKTLEEPTPGTVLILVSPRPGLLPATVRSRCQQVHFTVPPRVESLEWLKSQRLPADKLEAVLAMALGAPLRALELMEPETLEARQAFLADLGQIVAQRAGVVDTAEKWKARQTAMLVQWQLSWIQDVIRIAATGSRAWVRNPDLFEDLRGLSETIDLKALFRCNDRLLEHRRLLDVPLNPQLRLEDSLLAWAGLAPKGR